MTLLPPHLNPIPSPHETHMSNVTPPLTLQAIFDTQVHRLNEQTRQSHVATTLLHRSNDTYNESILRQG